ncbi:HAMP domain-containing histidine kinase [Treponema medium]|uniref:sensor histidine kinase n=1 Tax=Treponema medium TaxID=58231 RepID=UPI00197F26EC|nr:HAMP domain-containing sensor histidine kinase [Treponema medium]QSH91558.1 HAMP domain-containing histidine kinase [Treponema medium]
MKASDSPVRQLRISTVRQLSLRFSLLFAVMIALFSAGIIVLLRSGVRQQQNRELISAARTIAEALKDGRVQEIDADLPYYITFSVYQSGSQEVIATNDPFLPMLPVTPRRAERYTAKQYFIDGDLNILYYAILVHAGEAYVIQTALNMDSDTSESIISGVPSILAVVTVPLLLLSYIAVFFMTKHTMRSVRAMTDAAKNISGSNLTDRLPVTDRGDDFDVLAKTLNDLLSRLQTDFERERRFTADVSHELKTPLAVILGHANLLRRWGKHEPDRLEKSLSALIREAHSMEAIIENLLQMTRLENGHIRIHKTPVPVAEFFTRLIDSTQSYAPNVSFTESIGVPTLYTDEALLHQVCTIIISNSVKFAGETAHIELSIRPLLEAERLPDAPASESACIISISDNGPGIAQDILPHIFERFYRGDAAHTRGAGGAGLGLSIAASIMQALGGSIHAGNTQDKGTCIMLQLP